MRQVTVLSVAILLLFVVIRSYQAQTDPFGPGGRRPIAENEKYPYSSPQFTRFVEESYAQAASGSADDFYPWLEQAYASCSQRYPEHEALSLRDLLDLKRQELDDIPDPEKRAAEEMRFGAWLHRMVKTVIPRFSLERGFEFYNTVRRGERQCFLQAVLIAGLLQSADVYAGVAMVSKNIKGLAINNAHAVTLVKLANGKDIIVDASDPEPFARQKGLFVRIRDYRYVEPSFEPGSSTIPFYRNAADGQKVGTRSVRTLDYDFLRSQFAYYRGERARGGILAAAKTTEGLDDSARFFRTSIELAPGNPLSVYMLGRVYLAQGETHQANVQFNQAYRLYSRFGYVPVGPKTYYAKAHGL